MEDQGRVAAYVALHLGGGPYVLDLVVAPCHCGEGRGAQGLLTMLHRVVSHGCVQMHGQRHCAEGVYPAVSKLLSCTEQAVACTVVSLSRWGAHRAEVLLGCDVQVKWGVN